MKTEEFSNEGVWILFNIIIVVLKDASEELVLAVTDGLEHVFSICSVIKE